MNAIRLSIFVLLLAACLTSVRLGGAAIAVPVIEQSGQAVSPSSKTIPATDETRVGYANLGFSNDGKLLHVVGQSVADKAEDQHVRAITYDAATGAVVHVFNLQAGTSSLAITSDGGTAVVCAGCASGGRVQLSLLTTETGTTQSIPSTWFDFSNSEPNAGLSANGSLISIYSESGPAATPMAVSVYD